MKKITPLLLAGLLPGWVFSQAGGDTLSVTLPEIAVEAYPIARTQPAAVSLLPRAQLFREEGTTLVTSLQRIPGLFFQSGALNTNRLSIRGVGSRTPFGTAKVRAYLDEIPLTNGIGETAMEELDPSFLEQVSVWRGPSPAAYGAGLGGLLHLKTANSAGRRGTGWMVRNTLGSFGMQHHVVNARLQPDGERFSLQAGFNRLYSEGYRENNRFQRLSGIVLGKFQSGERHTFTVLTHLVGLDAQIPSSLNAIDFEENPEKAAPNWAAMEGYEAYTLSNTGLAWTTCWTTTWSTVLSVFQRYRESYEPRPFNILREDAGSQGLRMLLRKEWTSKLSMQSGGEYYQELYDWQTNAIYGKEPGELLSDNRERRRYGFLFAEADWRPSRRLSLHTGLYVNRTQYRLEDLFPQDSIDRSGDRGFPAVWSPRLSVLYRARAFSAFATLSHGSNFPTLEETLAPDGAINPGILPERGWNAELGLRRPPGEGLFFYELSLFHLWISDLLVARRTAEDQYIGVNAGRTLHRGLEGMIGWERNWLPRGHALSAYGSFTLADYRFAEFVDDGADFSGNALPGAPGVLLQSGMDGKYEMPGGGGLYANLTLQLAGNQYADDANEVPVDGYVVVNGKIGWEKAIGQKWQIELFAGCNNLLDARYASMLAINAQGFGGALPRYYYSGLPRNGYVGFVIRQL